MNIEEEKAIENLKDFAYKDGWVQVGKAKIVLKLIEKQQAELEKKDKVINEIEDLCIMKSDEDGQEYGGIIIWNFANKIMDIIKKAQK